MTAERNVFAEVLAAYDENTAELEIDEDAIYPAAQAARMKTLDPALVAKAAAEFCRLMPVAIGQDNLDEAVRLNRTAAYKGCCATHDFCDANEVMMEAFANLGLKTCVDYEEVEGPDWNAAVDLWNAAWDAAKAADFKL